MNKKILWAFLLSVVIAIPIVGFAEDSSNGSDATNTNANTTATTTRRIINKEAVKSQKETKKQAVQEIKEIKEIRDRIKEEWKEKEDDLNKAKEDRNKKVRDIRTNTQKTILEKRETLKINLKKISDQRKAQIVENTDKKLEKINDDRTDHLLDVLNNLEKTLAKINVRISAAEAKGVDVSSAKKVADDASKAIVAARTDVEAQAAKVYEMTITTENKLKADVGSTIKKLQDDLKQVRIIVQSAHDAVRKAAVALAKAMGFEDKPKSGSSSSSSVSSSVSSEAASSQSSS